MQEDFELAALRVVAEIAARGDFDVGVHRMVVEPRQPLEEAQVLEVLAGVNRQRVRIDARGDIPALTSEAGYDFGLERLVVDVEEVE